jgi:hypothetical protein
MDKLDAELLEQVARAGRQLVRGIITTEEFENNVVDCLMSSPHGVALAPRIVSQLPEVGLEPLREWVQKVREPGYRHRTWFGIGGTPEQLAEQSALLTVKARSLADVICSAIPSAEC